jgi:hypothetical protein
MDGLELTKKAIKLWESVHGSESLHLQCQRVSWYMQWAYQGNEAIVTYRTALVASRASKMFTKNVNDASIKAGDEMFWNIGTDGHVVTVIGRDAAGRVLVANSAKTGDNYKALGNHIFICHADTLPWKFLGASRANGKNKPKSGIGNWPALPSQDSSKPTSTEGNLVKIIYKTQTQPGGKPLWALADDEAVDPEKGGFVETRETNVVSGQWAPLYGKFHMVEEAEFVALRTKYRAGKVETSTAYALTDAQIDTLASRVAERVQIPTAEEIAKAVNNDAAQRLAQ